MFEFETREWIAFGLIGILVIAGTIGGLVFKRRRRWRKLRLAGDPTIKRRDAERR